MGAQSEKRHISMKAFIVLPALLAYASGAAQLLVRGAGQTSHQSVSKPFQGEHRSTVQSKAFGAATASVSDSPNRLHGARGVIGHPIAHAIAHPVAHAAYAAPVVHAAPAYHAPIVHAAPAYHAPVVHAAAGYAVPDLAEVSPHAYNYAGFVSEVSYEGTAAYPEALPVVRNVVAHAPVLAHPLAHAVGPAIVG